MTQILSGKKVAIDINDKLINKIEKLYGAGIAPTLAIVRVGENPGDIAYEKSAMKKANSLGIKVENFIANKEITEEDLIDIIKAINNNKEIHGVLLLRPLPKHIDDDLARNTLISGKDLDGISDLSMAGIFTDKKLGFSPCTAAACLEILKFYNVQLKGKKVVVIGRSLVIGKPVAMLLLKEHATVTICHSRTSEEDLINICKSSDIIIVATGKRNTITARHITEKQIVIDVGINFDEDGKICGDADFESIKDTVKALTPVPGGVGSVTTSILMKHLIEATENTLQK